MAGINLGDGHCRGCVTANRSHSDMLASGDRGFETDAGPSRLRCRGGGIAHTAVVKCRITRTIEPQWGNAWRLTAVEEHMGDDLRLDPASETEVGEEVPVFDDLAQTEKTVENGFRIVGRGQQQSKIESGIEPDAVVLTDNRSEQLVHDGQAEVQGATAGYGRGGSRMFESRCGMHFWVKPSLNEGL